MFRNTVYIIRRLFQMGIAAKALPIFVRGEIWLARPVALSGIIQQTCHRIYFKTYLKLTNNSGLKNI